LPELASSMGRVTPVAKALGVTQEELFAVMSTASGITGSTAEVSTQLRGVLQALMAPTKDMSALLDDLGYANGEAMYKSLGLQGTISKIVETAKSANQPLQNYMGSIEGQVLALALANDLSEGFTQNLNQNAEAAGAQTKAYKEQTEGINAMGHAWNRAQAIGQVALQKLTGVSPVIMMTGSLITMIHTLKELGIVMNLTKLRAIAMWVATLGPIALVVAAIAAVGLAVYGIYKHWDGIKKFFSAVWDGIAKGVTAGWEIIKNLFFNYHPYGLIIKHWDTIVEFFSTLWQRVWQATISGFGRTWDWLKDKLGGIAKVFQWLYDKLIGHSVVPDMINGIQTEFEKLNGAAMVKPVVRATYEADKAMSNMAGSPAIPTAGGAGQASNATDNLGRLIEVATAQLYEIRKLKGTGATA
jgi:hypothetical protein